jgi:hypothetical protein
MGKRVEVKTEMRAETLSNRSLKAKDPVERTVLAPWHICSQRGQGAAISSTNNTLDRFL